MTIVVRPNHGIAVVDPTTGHVTYTPRSDFSGIDTFGYTVADEHGILSNVATVNVNVSTNLPPIAGDDVQSMMVGQPDVFVPVLGNDRDLDGALIPTSITVVDPPSTAASASTRRFTRRFSLSTGSGYVGEDTFTYTVADNEGAFSNIATVTIKIVANQPAIASDDHANIIANRSGVLIDPTTNDFDPDGRLDLSSLTIVSPPAHGNAEVRPGFPEYGISSSPIPATSVRTV